MHSRAEFRIAAVRRIWIAAVLGTVLLLSSMYVPSAHAEEQADMTFASPTLFREFAPGIINASEGTVELQLRIDKPYEEFGNTAETDILFSLKPAQPGPGNNIIAAHIPPIKKQQVESTGSYDSPLTFLVRNGEGTNGVQAETSPARVDYETGEWFNLAFVWKLGEGGYIAIYKDGVEIGRTTTALAAIQEKYMPFEFTVQRANPYNVRELKVSTRALDASELQQTAAAYTQATDTALLASIGLGEEPEVQKLLTPWHEQSGYHAVKPAYRNDKQIFYENERAIYPIMTVNYSSEPQSYQVKLTGTDPYGQTVFTTQQPVVVPADATHRIQEIELPELDNRVGFWNIRAEVSSSAAAPILYDSGISKVPVNDISIADGPFSDYYGHQLSLEYDMNVWNKINTGVTRSWGGQFLWNIIEPVEGQFVWERTDAYVQQALDANLDVLAVVGYPPAWASTRPPVSEIPPGGFGHEKQYYAERYVSHDIVTVNGQVGDGDKWSNYIYQTMKRYAGKVKYWEIVNEVNFHTGFSPGAFTGTEAEYFQMLKLAYEQAQRVKAEYLVEQGVELELYVTSSGFTSHGPPGGDRQMILNALQAPNVNYLDIFNIHGYSGVQQIADVLQAYDQAKEIKPQLQLWQGEYYPVDITDNSRRIHNVLKNHMDFLAVGADKYFNMGSPDGDTFMTRHSQSPTVAFQTVAMLQHHIRKSERLIGSYDDFEGKDRLTVNYYFEQSDGTYLSVLAADSISLDIRVANAELIVYADDSFGFRVAYDEDKNAITLRNALFVISSEPLNISEVTSEEPADVLRNGSFEAVQGDIEGGPSGMKPLLWEVGYQMPAYGTPDQAPQAYLNKTDVYEGEFAQEFNSASAPGNRTFLAQSIRLPEAGTYRLSAYIKRLSGTDVQPELNIWDYTQDHQLAPVALTNEYAYYSQNFTASAAMDIYVNVGILSGDGRIVVDNVKMELLPEDAELIIDERDASRVVFVGGSWDHASNRTNNYNETASLNRTMDGLQSAIFTPDIPLDGMYEVYQWFHFTEGGASDAPYTIKHANGTETMLINQNNINHTWKLIGEFPFRAGTNGQVTVTNGHTSRTLIVDAMRFVRVGPIVPAEPTAEQLVLAGAEQAIKGEPYKVVYRLNRLIDPVLAQEIVISYPADSLEFVTAAVLLPGLQLIGEPQVDSAIGQVVLRLASLGAAHAVSSDENLAELLFTVKSTAAVQEAEIAATATAASADGTERTLETARHRIELLAMRGDLNGDGRISIGDLAIVAAAYGLDSSATNWELIRKADVNGDSVVDLDDLVFVAQKF